jgi:hypothetical protein
MVKLWYNSMTYKNIQYILINITAKRRNLYGTEEGSFFWEAPERQGFHHLLYRICDRFRRHYGVGHTDLKQREKQTNRIKCHQLL